MKLKKFLVFIYVIVIWLVILTITYTGVPLLAFQLTHKRIEPSDNKLLGTFVLPHPPVIVPEVGGSYTFKALKTKIAMSYVAEQITANNPDTVILVTPHSKLNSTKFNIYKSPKLKGDLEKFGAEKTKLLLNNDTDFIKNLEQNLQETKLKTNGLPVDITLDHGSFVPMYYLNKAGYKGKYVVINYSGLSREKHIEFGEIIRKIIESSGKKVVFIASGDLSHSLTKKAPNGYNANGKVFDKKIINAIKSGNYDAIKDIEQPVVSEAAQCGYNSILVALGVVGMKPQQNYVFSYEAPFGVGYIVGSL